MKRLLLLVLLIGCEQPSNLSYTNECQLKKFLRTDNPYSYPSDPTWKRPEDLECVVCPNDLSCNWK